MNERADAAKIAWTTYVEEVRAALEPRIAELIQPLARQWTQQGQGTWKCLSPLRSEKTASFYVYAGRGYHDFGTNEGGNALTFLQKFYKCTWREAVDRGASFVGIELWEARKKRLFGGSGSSAPIPTPAQLDAMWNAEADRDRVFEAMAALQHIAAACLPARIHQHLTGHYGLTDEFIAFEKIGYVPEAFWELCTEPHFPRFDGEDETNPFYLLGTFTREELLATGWFHVAGDHVHSTFAGRIVFPYWSRAQCRYAIGREYHGPVPKELATIEEWDKGKYKKLPLFDPKKRPYVSPHLENVLWGVDTIGRSREGHLVITEGMTDAQMFAQLGFAVISPITVAFRKSDIDLVRAMLATHKIKRVTILNDADVLADGRRPGLAGAKSMAAALSDRVDVRIGLLPKPAGVAKVDVNELGAAAMRAGGEDAARELLQSFVDKSKPYVEFLIDDLSADAPAEELDVSIREIGKLSVNVPTLARSARVTLLRTKLPGFPRGPLARTFDAGVAEGVSAKAIADQRAEEETAAADPDAPKKRIDTTGIQVGAVLEELAGYCRINPTGGTDLISNFAFELVEVAVQAQGPAWLVVRVWQDGGKLVDRWAVPPKAWCSKRAFLSAMPSEHMTFTGSDDNVQGILGLLHEKIREVPRLQLTNVLGRHAGAEGAARFVVPAGVLDVNGWMSAPDFLYEIEGGTATIGRKQGAVRDVDLGDIALAARFLAEAPTLHDEVSAAIALGWMTASLFREPWGRMHAGAFPILNVYGRPGSGKSSFFARLLWPAFTGVERSEPISCTATPFAMIRDLSSSNALAQMFDEYKPSDMGQRSTEQILRLMRRSYAGEDETRGRADQSIARYPMVAPVVILGETRLAEDQALHERCVFLSLPGRYLPTHPETPAKFAALLREPLWQVAPLLWRWSLGVDVDTLGREAEGLAGGALTQLDRATLPLRLRFLVKTILFGLLAYDEACRAFGAPVGTVNPLHVVSRILSESLDEDDTGGLRVAGAPRTQPLDSLDLWVRAAAELAVLGELVEGTHFFWIDDRLHLFVKGIDAVLTKWSNDHGQVKHSPGARSLVRIAAEKREADGAASYVVSTNKRTKVSPQSVHRVRCLVLDPAKAPEALGVAGVPCSTSRSHGRDPLAGWKLEHETEDDDEDPD